jgi:hypothetical protein
MKCGECDAVSQLQIVNLNIEQLGNFRTRMIVRSLLDVFVNIGPNYSGHKSQSKIFIVLRVDYI